MISHEDLYQLLFKESWSEILNILYKEKDNIKNDSLLTYAAQIFENEFFKKALGYDLDRKDIIENLEKMYLLHHGKFYTLSDVSYKNLILEIVRRTPLEQAYNYALKFPNEDLCKKTISNFEFEKVKKEGFKLSPPSKLPMNWIEIYNRLFEIINNQSDTATYFSGPRFIDTVKNFEPYFPSYQQFIERRNGEGKSTTRKIYYYDILLGLSEDSRTKVIRRILEIARPFEPAKVEQIENILDNKIVAIPQEEQTDNQNRPIVFISYSWDNEEHKKWVLALADRLRADGVDAILDRYYLKPGKNLPHFVEDNLAKAHRVIIVFTQNYKLKADKRTGGVGYEYSIMNVELYKNQTSNEKIIPILREGSIEDSIPTFMQQFIHIDTRNDENFENSYKDLVREIYNEPEIKKPAIGVKPSF